MTDSDDLLAHERIAVERARHGDHDAFVELYRQDAPPAWRLALALTREPAPAAFAVADGFRRVLAPRAAAVGPSQVPFRLRLLTATRHAVLDARPPRPRPSVLAAAPGSAAGTEVDAMASFHQLPERWRSALWLLAVEGLGSADVACVLDIHAEEAEDLVERARAGLHQRWHLDHPDADATVVDLVEDLRPLVPLPMSLFAQAEARWLAALGRPAGPLHLTFPGGRPVPVWAERTLVGATGLLIALGITGALLSDRDATTPRDDHLAASTLDRATKQREDTVGEAVELPPEPLAYLDGDDGELADRGNRAPTTTTVVTIDPRTGLVTARAAAPATAVDEPAPAPSTTTTAPPLLEVTAGVGDTLGLSVGDRCTGVEILGTVLGCPPATKDDGLTLEAGSALLPDL